MVYYCGELMDLSIVHTTYNRAHHLRAILPRVELNAKRYPWIDFEFIILDGGSNDDTRKLSLEFLDRNVCKCKYLRVNFARWVNPSLPRNIALRHAEGRIGCTTDADHWLGQDFVFGAYAAYLNGEENRVNIGMVWDTNESRKLPWTKVNKALLSPELEGDLNILELYRVFGIPIKKPKSGWIVSYPMWAVHEIGGYDEDFSGSMWGRDEDIFLLKLQHILETTKDCYIDFAALHLCHDVKQFGIQRNATHNHKIFKEKLGNIETLIENNKVRQWGQVPEGVEFTCRRNFS